MAYAPAEKIRSSKIHQETVDDSAAGKRWMKKVIQ